MFLYISHTDTSNTNTVDYNNFKTSKVTIRLMA